MENGPHVPTTKVVTETDFSDSDCGSCVYDTAEGKDESVVDVNNRQEGGENCRKSNLRKVDSDGDENGVKSILRRADSNGKEVQKKKKVQWKDFLGNELAEIREFEPRCLFSLLIYGKLSSNFYLDYIDWMTIING